MEPAVWLAAALYRARPRSPLLLPNPSPSFSPLARCWALLLTLDSTSSLVSDPSGCVWFSPFFLFATTAAAAWGLSAQVWVCVKVLQWKSCSHKANYSKSHCVLSSLSSLVFLFNFSLLFSWMRRMFVTVQSDFLPPKRCHTWPNLHVWNIKN